MSDLETSYSCFDEESDDSETDYSAPQDSDRWIYDTGSMGWMHYIDDIVSFNETQGVLDESDMNHSERRYSSLDYSSDENMTEDYRFMSIFEHFQ